MSTLLVCSQSTRGYLSDYWFPSERVRIVSTPPTIDILKEIDTEDNVVAIGGGSVIDTAKIICKNPIICYPTTASGSSATSWAIYWGKESKYSIERKIPKVVVLKPKFAESLPKHLLENTIADAVSHCLDSLCSIKSNSESRQFCRMALMLLDGEINKEIIEAGHIAGKAIQITGTNLLHCLSYPISIHYNMSHGEALLHLLPKISKYMDYDISVWSSKFNMSNM